MVGLEKLFLSLFLVSTTTAFRHGMLARSMFSNSLTTNQIRPQKSLHLKNSIFRSRTLMSMTETPQATQSTEGVADIAKAVEVTDFSKYAAGQEYEGTVQSAKAFGVFVDIKTGTNVLLPKSLLSRMNFEKLKAMADSKSKETIRIEIVDVSSEKKTLSGKYLSKNFKNRPDLSTLSKADLSSKYFNGTVISSHDFGMFVELDDYGVEGLVPASRLPEKLPKGTIKSSYP